MRVIKKIVMISVVLWVLLVVFGSNIPSISDCIWELMNALMPVVIVIIGIGLMIRSIFK